MANTDLSSLLETCAQLPTEEAVARLIEARGDFVMSGDLASAAVCVREAILRRFRARDLDRALPLAEELANEAGRIDDALLYGLLCERAGLKTRAQEIFEIARARAQAESETLLVACFIGQQAGQRPTDAEDAATYASLGDAYLDMGLTADAVRTLLVGVRSYPDDWQVVDVLVESLVAGKLTRDTRESSPTPAP